jgi:hypothetical protein
MKALLILLATLAFVAAPAVTPSFTGYDPGLFPVRIPRPSVQPAGYAFSIWGLIYFWLMVSATLGLARRDDPAWARPFLPHLAALILGTLWLAIAPAYPITATLTIIAMAVCTWAAFLRADPAAGRWLQQAPLGLFAGWLTAAAAVSTGVLLSGYGWLSDTGAALTMLTLTLGVAITLQSRRPAMPLYSAAVIWAALGIAVMNWVDNPTVALAALAGAALQTGIAATLYLRRPA